MSRKFRLIIDTVKYLRPKQIIGQFKKPLIMKTVPRISDYRGSINTSLKTVIQTLDMNSEYLNRFNVERIILNEFSFLNETHPIDISTWASDASPLWRFNLHYFEYTIALAIRYANTLDGRYCEKFKELVQSWIAANPVGYGDAWHPYTISMRLPNWCISIDLFGDLLVQDKSFFNEMTQSMYKQYKVLLKRQETWQLGNHYFENLKTVVFCSLLFEDKPVFDKYINRFLQEVREEILPDGVHFELSIMYHKVILDDMIRVAYWLKQADKPHYNNLLPVIQEMINAIASLEKGMGKTPLFNDAGDGIAKTTESLIGTANELFGIIPVLSDEYPASGYYKLYNGDTTLIFDAGKIGPDYMPGHGHCDCLSFELSVDGKPLFVNSGTYQYQGDRRTYFRSTRAHNTITINGKEQSECWGEHRLARRIHNISAEKDGNILRGTYTSFSGDKHTRTIALDVSALKVSDTTVCAPGKTVNSYLHIAPGYSVESIDGVVYIESEELRVEVHANECDYKLHTSGELCNYSPEFGLLQQGTCLEFTWMSDKNRHGYIIKLGDNSI